MVGEEGGGKDALYEMRSCGSTLEGQARAILSGVGKQKWRSVRRASIIRSAFIVYRLALVYLLFRLLPLIREISVPHFAAHLSPRKKTDDFRMTARFSVPSFARLVFRIRINQRHGKLRQMKTFGLTAADCSDADPGGSRRQMRG